MNRGSPIMHALSRGKIHQAMLKRVGLDQTIRIPSHIGSPGLPNLPLLSIHAPAGADDCVLQGITECKKQRCICLNEWRQEIIFDDGRDKLTRQSLLWIIRDKEGVGHFDSSVSSCSAYSALFNHGHDNYYYQRLMDNLGVLLNFQNSPLYIVKEEPPANSFVPPAHPQRYPLLGGIDGVIRTMGTEMLIALG